MQITRARVLRHYWGLPIAMTRVITIPGVGRRRQRNLKMTRFSNFRIITVLCECRNIFEKSRSDVPQPNNPCTTMIKP